MRAAATGRSASVGANTRQLARLIALDNMPANDLFTFGATLSLCGCSDSVAEVALALWRVSGRFASFLTFDGWIATCVVTFALRLRFMSHR